MKNSHYKPNDKKVRMVLLSLILLPVFFTAMMWAVLPSGYRSYIQNQDHQSSITTWHPLQAGLKQVVISLY